MSILGEAHCRAFSGGFKRMGVGAAPTGLPHLRQPIPGQVTPGGLWPFSLADASQAELGFQLWLNAEPGCDYVCRMASIDGTNSMASAPAATTAGGPSGCWISPIFPIGGLEGHRQSGWAAVHQPMRILPPDEGGFVDDIVLRVRLRIVCDLFRPGGPAGSERPGGVAGAPPRPR